MVAVKGRQREVVKVLLEPSRYCQVNLQEKVCLNHQSDSYIKL